MSPELILHELGYLGVFIGTFFEGETILVIASFLAERGHLMLEIVIPTAFLGAFSGHMFWFWIGRRHIWRLIERFPHFNKRFKRVTELFERYGVLAILITQYLYGLRVASAIVFGLSEIRARTFILWQAISCLVWATLIATLGYLFGHVVESFLGRAASVEKVAVIAIVVVAVVFTIVFQLRDRGKSE